MEALIHAEKANRERQLGSRHRLTPELFNKVARQYWGVENSLHWRLDVAMNENQERTRMGYGPQNLAELCYMSLNAIEKERAKGS
jgi:predicted transposase YbfD/YdcC